MKNQNFNFWCKKAGIRAVKTLAQAAVATIGTSALLTEVDWKVVASTAVLAAILSLLTSIAGLPEVTAETEIKENADYIEAGKSMLDNSDKQFVGEDVPNKAETNEPKVYEED